MHLGGTSPRYDGSTNIFHRVVGICEFSRQQQSRQVIRQICPGYVVVDTSYLPVKRVRGRPVAADKESSSLSTAHLVAELVACNRPSKFPTRIKGEVRFARPG